MPASKKAWCREAVPPLILSLRALKDLKDANEEHTTGIRLLARAVEEPLRQSVENAGEDAAVVLTP